MNTRTRYFVIASLLVLTVGLGAGLVAYYAGFPMSALSRQGGPEELKFVPADASLVAFANVQEIMTSAVRQKLRHVLPFKEDGQQEFQNHTGINIETDIDRVVAFVVPTSDTTGHMAGAAMVLARGRFDVVKIESSMREHGARTESYKGKRLIVSDLRENNPALSVAFLAPGLVAVGSNELVHRAADLVDSVDRKAGSSNVTTNKELMDLVHDLDSGNAWAVGRFDVLASHAKLPSGLREQLPPVTWFSASAHVNGGVSAVVRAESRDEESASSLRDVVRGGMALVKLQAGSKPEFQTLIQSLRLGGTGKTVSLSFDLPLEAFDAIGALVDRHHPDVTPRP
jgi:hypothetical protein